MQIIIDTNTKKMKIDNQVIDLYSKKAFEVISEQWVKIGWNQKYVYTFSWLGRPIIQLPEDIIRIQELIYRIKPNVIIETGVAHGGSLVYYSTICKSIGKGRVVGVDIEIREHNRKAIEAHEMFELITLIEGNSIDNLTLEKVKSNIQDNEIVLVILDSCHTKDHVSEELEKYSELVSKDSYLVVQDGIMKELYDVPRGKVEWKDDNPQEAVREFLLKHDEFILDTPNWIFNESELSKSITHWPSAWLKRIK